jgi:hypothetical protein
VNPSYIHLALLTSDPRLSLARSRFLGFRFSMLLLDGRISYMSTTNNFTDFHLRDFVTETGQNPTRSGYDSALQLKANVNIPAVQGEGLSDDFDIVCVPTLVRIFAGSGSADRFKPGVFIYATGTFSE